MKHVLFVCVENACRSQMAEGFLNALAGKKASAKSAGNMPAKTVNPLAVQVMKEVGLDISDHKPKMITAFSWGAAETLARLFRRRLKTGR
jgi:protein-tyrosine-phosphatase